MSEYYWSPSKEAFLPSVLYGTLKLHVPSADDDGARLDRWFKRHMPDAPFTLVSRWARTGQLRLDGARATPGDRIEAGQLIRVPPADSAPAATARPKVQRQPLTADDLVFNWQYASDPATAAVEWQNG